jgi:hypothetical protein
MLLQARIQTTTQNIDAKVVFCSVTRLSQRLLPNVVLKFYQIGFFFTKHVQIPRFEISGCVQSL